MWLRSVAAIIITSLQLKPTEKSPTAQQDCPSKKADRYGNPIVDVLPKHYRWPNATVPYLIADGFDLQEVATISKAMETLENVSCVRFVRRSHQNNYLLVTNQMEGGCWADTGRQRQPPTYLNIPHECTHNLGTVLHELMHVLGFLHQHTRPDRDRHVCILYENVVPEPGALYNYEIVEPSTDLAFPVPYDYESIMHYRPDMYSIEPGRLVTMVPQKPWIGTKIGHRDRLTEFDVLAINFLYCV
ncbi:high choriolytic enzyme 1-like [Anopheles bellator]|uniref:high choriolytic enzyme 1-like n=1 Tax=Anopheles bellator TaxID=139047 RepID=UPI00264A0C05|nr:high choriolytic enzyme 1-like [Anopheles bellator]